MPWELTKENGFEVLARVDEPELGALRLKVGCVWRFIFPELPTGLKLKAGVVTEAMGLGNIWLESEPPTLRGNVVSFFCLFLSHLISSKLWLAKQPILLME